MFHVEDAEQEDLLKMEIKADMKHKLLARISQALCAVVLCTLAYMYETNMQLLSSVRSARAMNTSSVRSASAMNTRSIETPAVQMEGMHDFDKMLRTLDSDQLATFLRKFPKGAELHSHQQGAISPEDLLEVAEGHSYQIDTADLTVFSPGLKPAMRNLQDLDSLVQNPDFRERIIRSWSIHGFDREAGLDEHFFATFTKFKALTEAFTDEVTTLIVKRGKRDGLAYLELMANPFTSQLKDLVSNAEERCGFSKKHFRILPDCLDRNGISDVVADIQRKTDAQGAKLLASLGYQPFDAGNGHGPVLRYLYQVARAQKPAAVMTLLYTAFLLVEMDERFVGVNLVQREDNEISLRDYDLHMSMLAFLRARFHRVPITLHAGEIAPGGNARDHIRKAVEAGGASRIGHGVNILADTRSDALLETMANKGVLVEINLSSNDAILRVRGKAHPLRLYLNHQVPVALCTDDQGTLRTDITREFVRAVREHNVSYSELKLLARSSLTHSFLEGASLWEGRPGEHMKDVCASLSDTPSVACRRFLQENPKAQLEWKLETSLVQFEREILTRRQAGLPFLSEEQEHPSDSTTCETRHLRPTVTQIQLQGGILERPGLSAAEDGCEFDSFTSYVRCRMKSDGSLFSHYGDRRWVNQWSRISHCGLGKPKLLGFFTGAGGKQCLRQFVAPTGGAVVKLNHQPGNVMVLSGGARLASHDYRGYVSRMNKAYFGRKWGEHHYMYANRGVIIEQFLTPDGGAGLPADFKFMFFDGITPMVQIFGKRVHRGGKTSKVYSGFNAKQHQVIAFDPRLLDNAEQVKPKDMFYTQGFEGAYTKPCGWDRMVKAATCMSQGLTAARIDLYLINCMPYLGEVTVTPAGGFDFLPEEQNRWLGTFISKDAPLSGRILRHQQFDDTPPLTCEADGPQELPSPSEVFRFNGTDTPEPLRAGNKCVWLLSDDLHMARVHDGTVRDRGLFLGGTLLRKVPFASLAPPVKLASVERTGRCAGNVELEQCCTFNFFRYRGVTFAGAVPENDSSRTSRSTEVASQLSVPFLCEAVRRVLASRLEELDRVHRIVHLGARAGAVGSCAAHFANEGGVKWVGLVDANPGSAGFIRSAMYGRPEQEVTVEPITADPDSYRNEDASLWVVNELHSEGVLATLLHALRETKRTPTAPVLLALSSERLKSEATRSALDKLCRGGVVVQVVLDREVMSAARTPQSRYGGTWVCGREMPTGVSRRPSQCTVLGKAAGAVQHTAEEGRAYRRLLFLLLVFGQPAPDAQQERREEAARHTPRARESEASTSGPVGRATPRRNTVRRGGWNWFDLAAKRADRNGASERSSGRSQHSAWEQLKQGVPWGWRRESRPVATGKDRAEQAKHSDDGKESRSRRHRRKWGSWT